MSIGQNIWCSFFLNIYIVISEKLYKYWLIWLKKRARCNTELFINILVILSDFRCHFICYA